MRTILFSILCALTLVVGLPSASVADINTGCTIVAEAVNPTEAGGTDDYINFTDGTIGTTAAAEDEFIVPTEMVASRLIADVDVAPGAGDIWVVTVVDDGTATSLTCSITGTNTSCSETSFSLRPTIAAGSDLTVLLDSSTGATDPAIAAELRVSFCLQAK